ncbi:MAG: metal-sulfur cluster assembly factor [bacterium]
MHALIEEKLQTVYDPEFPMVDIFTLGLIYTITIQEEEKIISILMTFTTAACPMAEMLQEMVKNAVMEVAPEYEILIEITFDPMRTIDMIKDEDLKRMFE